MTRQSRTFRWNQLGRLTALAVVTLVMSAAPVHAAPKSAVVPLPGATGAEGIASGRGSTFYAGDLFTGDVFRGDLQHGTAALFIDAPANRMAAGLKFDPTSGLLFVSGLSTGQGYVYDTATRSTVAVYQFADPGEGIINDVTLSKDGAWFTDSVQPQLYFVPIVHGAPGPFRTLPLSGPAAAITGDFNVNGIASTPNGATLIVAHSANAGLYTVNPTTGASAVISGVSVPNVDGILLDGPRLWAVQNFSNQISEIRLSPDLGSGVIEQVITSSLFQIPTTVARHGNRLAAVNAKFDTGFPPTATQYEAVIVDR